MRLFMLRIVGLIGALALLCAFGLVTQANAAPPAAPAVSSVLIGPAAPVVSGWSGQVQAGTQDSTLKDVQEASAWNPTTMVGFHLERRLKLHHYWTAEDGTYCTIKGGGEVFVPAGAPVEAGLTC